MQQLFSRCRRKFYGQQYSLDAWDELLQHLCRHCKFAAPGESEPVKGRLLLDKNYLSQRQCVGQIGCVREMVIRGCQVKMIKPDGNGFACMHVKSWLIDDAIYVTGSQNSTHQSLGHNIEEFLVVTNRAVCEQKRRQFEQLWMNERCIEVDQLTCEEIAKRPTRTQARAEAKAGAKARAVPVRGSASSGSAASIAPPQQS